jgi:hypothetical protein
MEPPHILNLPGDILYKIFTHFQCDKIHRGLFDESIYDDNPQTVKIKLQTIKTARLVCRLFNLFASPLLCPTLRVRLDHASLDFVDKVSESPHIANGVYNIEIVVDYCPRELATDLLRFGKFRVGELVNRIRGCCAYTMWEIEVNGEGHEDNPDYPHEEYQQTIEYCEKLRSAWLKYVKTADKGSIDAISLEFLHLLVQGHQEYIQKHEEQFQLITNGSFIERLISAMSRMAHCSSIHFIDDVDCYSMPENVSPLAFRDDARELSRFMTSPLSWDYINHLQGGAEILPAKLLWGLPIALYEAGLTLRAMLIRTFPHPNCCPVSNPTTWTNLYNACQHLEVFILERMNLNNSSGPFDSTSRRKQALIEQYIGAVLSSEVLEVIKLRFFDSTSTTVSYRVGLLPKAINWPRIKKLTIAHISLSQEELEILCSGLGYMLEDLYLYKIDLRSGNWADALDMLRERVPKNLQRMRPPYFSELTGGEFGKGNRNLVEGSLDYVFRVKTKNPMRGTSHNVL